MKMLRRGLFLAALIALSSCGGGGGTTITIGSFPVEIAAVQKAYDMVGVNDPVQMVVTDKYLFLMGAKSDTIFQQYELPDLNFVKGFGIRGRGPGEYSSTPVIDMSRNPDRLYVCRSELRSFDSCISYHQYLPFHWVLMRSAMVRS